MAFSDEQITILLATYNGEKYLSHQLNSILNQTYSNWRLLIRDDDSTDATPAIIQQYKQLHPDKIEVIIKEEENRGSLFNFSALLQETATAKYIMFCDQDDEWKPDKIEITFLKMKEMETQYGANHPILIFTNFQYVDENMNLIESKKNFEIIRIKNFGFPQLLAQNPVYGCTTMINRALADRIGAIPPQADYHDHWIALVASAFGKLYYFNEKTVLYRQHGSNTSGSWDNDSLTKRFRRILIEKKNFKEAESKYIMLMAFKRKYYNDLHKDKKSILDNFLSLYTNKNPFRFLKSIYYGVRSLTIAQSLLLYITIFLQKKVSQL